MINPELKRCGISDICKLVLFPETGLLILSYSLKSTLATSATLDSLSEYSVQVIHSKVLISAMYLEFWQRFN
jgi:hypothetical protein